jgi:hypothetical protein
VDFHHPFLGQHSTPHKAYRAAQGYTIAWGIFSVLVAMFAHNLGNSLIEAVNILGSLFYGVILGIFLAAFYLKRVGGHAVFTAALLAEAAVIAVYLSDSLSFLWLNLVGALLVLGLSLILQPVFAVSSARGSRSS